MQHRHLSWAQHHYYAIASTWRPQLGLNDPAYSCKDTPTRKDRTREKKKEQADFDRNAWGALGEVVRMAEGRDGISLGRMNFVERKV
jgi:hypothetical protein